MNRTVKGICKKAAGIALASLVAAGAFAQEIAGTPTGKGTPKYVFVFIGDGMSYPQIQSSAYFIGKDAAGIVDEVKNSSNPSDSPVGGLLSFMKFPVAGSAQTYDATSFAPDSASTATSIFTGKKTHSSSINVDISKKNKVPHNCRTASRPEKVENRCSFYSQLEPCNTGCNLCTSGKPQEQLSDWT